MNNRSLIFICVFLGLIAVGNVVRAENVTAQSSVQRDWGILLFPATEQYNLIEFYLKWASSYRAALDEAAQTGMTRAVMTKSWSELEPKKDKYDLDSYNDMVSLLQKRGIDIFYGLQVINTVKREVPEDLKSEPWNSPEMIARVIAILDKTLPVISGGRTAYLSLGNEVDVYFEKNPDEVPTYRELYQQVRDHVRAKYPHIVTGITTTFEGLHGARKELINRITRDADILIMTYYPVSDLKVHAPSSPHEDLKEMTNYAGKKPLLLQEAGYPSGTEVGSNEKLQAEFIRQFFAAWDENAAAIPYISLFMQHDFGSRVCGELTSYYGFDGYDKLKMFEANICTLGLKDGNGKPKEAWNVLTQEVAPKLKTLNGRR